MGPGEDEALRLLAVERLGALAHPLAIEALESGSLTVEPDVLVWSGSLGTVHGHRVLLAVESSLCARVHESPAAVDALTAAIAAAVAQRSGNALANLDIVGRKAEARRSSPYRGRR